MYVAVCVSTYVWVGVRGGGIIEFKWPPPPPVRFSQLLYYSMKYARVTRFIAVIVGPR